MHGVLEVLAHPWTLQILWTLWNSGPTRFGALRHQVQGVSSRVLTQRLRALEEKGFLYRDYEKSIPPAVTYGMTHRMKKFGKILGELEALARKWEKEDGRNKIVRNKIGPKKIGPKKIGRKKIGRKKILNPNLR